MARNKYPQETVYKILDVSLRLFTEKGYDNTSIQDIIDGLGGLSKGAIYHHFKSKSDILLALAGAMESHTDAVMGTLRDNPDLTAQEKLHEMFHLTLRDNNQKRLFATSPNLLENPQILTILLQSLVRDAVPNYIAPIVRQGVAEGSIHTDHPDQLAEMLLLLSNFWLNPLIWPSDPVTAQGRLDLYDQLLRSHGLDLVDQELRDAVLALIPTPR